jgi:tetratricopeptide (TPR) repeat protein
VFSLQGSREPALRAFDHALRFSPDYPMALKGKVQLLYGAHDKRALPLLERILKVDPNDATAQEMLANLEARQGNCERAIRQFTALADHIHTHPESLAAYGNCLVQANQAERAIPVFTRLAALLPQQTYPKYDLAVVLVEAKQYAAALQVLDPLLTAGTADPDLLSLGSEAAEGMGDTPKAVSLLRQAIVLSPATASYYVSFAALCLNHDSFQVGIDMINAGLTRIHSDPSLYIARGLLYAQLAQYDQAESDFRTAEQFNSAQSVSSFAIDLAEMQKNHPEAALAQIRSQIKQHPESALLHYLLARLLADQGGDTDKERTDEVLSAAARAVQLKPDLIEARDLMASTYTRMGKYDLAIEQSRRALQYNPADQTAIYHLIVALRHSAGSGQREEIQSLVKRLSDLQTQSRQQETDRKRFKLEEQNPAEAK